MAQINFSGLAEVYRKTRLARLLGLSLDAKPAPLTSGTKESRDMNAEPAKER